MNTKQSMARSNPFSPRWSKAGFTLKELLTVLAVVTVLVCVRISAMTGANGQAKVAQCEANLKQFSLAAQLYGNENNSNLPQLRYGNWPWDMDMTATALLAKYGAGRSNMYCPGFPQQNFDQNWNGFFGPIRTLGYANAFPGAAGVFPDDVNNSLLDPVISLAGWDTSLGPAGSLYKIIPSQRVLLADATISSNGQFDPSSAASYQWINHTESGSTNWPISPLYGPWLGASTPHMAGAVPAGGNLAMLDGHVEWHPFTNMLIRGHGQFTGDYFWW